MLDIKERVFVQEGVLTGSRIKHVPFLKLMGLLHTVKEHLKTSSTWTAG